MKSIYLILLLVILTLGTAGLLPAQNQSDIPDPTRFEQEINAFEQWDTKNSSPKESILFVGSSSINFWNTAEAFSDYPVINRGFGGSHISDLLHYYDQVIGRFDPSLIVFYCGENDIASGLNSDKVFDGYKELLSRIEQDFPNTHFLYITIKPSSSRLEYTEPFTEFNHWVKTFNKTNDRLHYIDLATPLTNGNGRSDDSFFVDDLLHLNEQGYEIWSERMAEFLKTMEESGQLVKQ
ncbi:MAG: GDSL-type esterase/lipase family protein [Balneolaceae bacterium]